MCYGQEVVVIQNFKQQAPKIALVIKLHFTKAKKDRLFQLQKLEEDRLNSIHHQEVKIQQQKSWHNRDIKSRNISLGDIVLLYDS